MKKSLLLLTCALVASQAFAGGPLRADTDQHNFRPSTNVSFSETTLPIVYITVNGQIIQRESRVLATMKIIDNGDGHNYTDLTAHPSQKVDWEGPVALKYRGNTSFTGSDKKPFSIKTLSAADLKAKKAKVSIMGMGKDNDWALLAPWEDTSYMRDVLTMQLARGGHSFAPHMKYCEVFVDGYYYGVYIMSERATKGKTRLNLDDPTADDLTGDFHVEIDRKDEEHYYVSKHHPVSASGVEYTDRTVAYQYKEPEYDDFADLPAGTQDAIDNAIATMEDAFASADYKGENGYRKYIDVESFIDFQIAQEMAGNVDAYRLSSPLYKYSETHAAELGTDSKWKTALWDFNIAYGTASYYDANKVNTWRYTSNDLMAYADQQLVPFFWYKLMNDAAYVDELHQRWTDLRSANYSETNITAQIDSLAAVLKESGALDRDNQAWRNHFGTFDDAVSTLKTYCTSRLAFIDKSWKLKEPIDADIQTLAVASGFNADIIAEALTSSEHTTATVDQTGYVLYTKAVRESGALAGDDGVVMSDAGVTYQLADYTKNNALLLTTSSDADVVFDSPVAAKSVYCLALSGDGASELTITPRYADGTKGDAFTASVPDWYSSSAQGDEAVYGLGRILTSMSGGWQGATDQFDNNEYIRLYEIEVATDPERQLSGLTMYKTGGRTSVLAMTAVKEKVETSVDRLSSGAGKTLLGIYSADGVRRTACRKGINILRYSDGSAKKIVKR